MYCDGIQDATWGDVIAVALVAVYVIVTLSLVANDGRGWAAALALPRRVLAWVSMALVVLALPLMAARGEAGLVLVAVRRLDAWGKLGC